MIPDISVTAPKSRPCHAFKQRLASSHGSAIPRGRRRCLILVTFYAKNLAVPKRRDVDDAEVLRGKEIFLRERLHRLPPAEIRDQPQG